MKIGDVKFAKLADDVNTNSLRCAAYQYSCGVGCRVGNAIRIAFFWQYNIVAAVCVSHEDYVEHKYDRGYTKEWKPQVEQLLEEELQKEKSYD